MTVKLLTFALAAMLAAACSRDPQRSAQEYAESGDRFVAERKYAEAILEYRNALAQTPSGEVRFKLARAYEQVGNVADATLEYIRAADALPGNVEVQLRAAAALRDARRFQEAQERAEAILKLDPQNIQAHIIRGHALMGTRDFEAALKELEEAIKLDPTSADLLTNVGAVQTALGRRAEAEAAYRKAVELGPKQAAPHLALAEFLWSLGNVAESEQALKRVLEIDDKHRLAHRGLAQMYMATRRLPLAEPHLKFLADSDVSPNGVLKLSLADYYVLIRKPEQALKVLEGMQNVKEGLSNVQSRLAMLRYENPGPAEGNRIIDDVLKRDPNNVHALMTKARFQMNEKNLSGALRNAELAVAADSTSAEARHLVGLIHRAEGRLEQARIAFTEVLQITPRATGVQMQLAELNLALGQPAEAMPLASDVVRQAPGDVQAHLLLIRAQAAGGQAQLAQRSMNAVLKALPNDARVQATAGTVALARKDLAGARRAFNRAQELDASSVEAFNGLIAVDLAENKRDGARARADERLAKSPKDPVAMTTAARVYATTGDYKRAEELLRNVITQSPSDMQAYSMLGQIYTLQKRLPEALKTYEDLLKKEPQSVPLNTMIGILHETQGRSDVARKHYERVMEIDKGAAVAANNLAYIYAEKGGNLDVALALAQTAKQKLPDSAQVADTIGWIYVKKNLPKLALPELRQAVALSPNNANSHYHLGVALSRDGDNARARRSLERALALNLEPVAAAEARKLAASLGRS